jgi:glycosyltransferase involved in cell wall biosynthesis
MAVRRWRPSPSSVARVKMRPPVAILVEQLGPYHVARFRALRRRLGAGRVHAIEIAGRSAHYDWAEVVADGFDVVRLFPDADYGALGGGALRASVVRALDRLRPEAVAVNGWGFVEARAALRWCRRTATAAVLMSDSQDGGALTLAPKELAKRFFVRTCGSAFVAGSRHASYVAKLGMPADRVVQGYDVVDNAHFASGAERVRAQRPENARKLGLPERFWLCCARFIPEKNLPMLVEAYASYRRRSAGSAWDLVLVGDGPLRGRLRARISDLGVASNVQLRGFVQYPELPALYGLASALVLPSASETWGLVVNEAMAAGLPVLVSRACGCVPELVRDGVNGFAFDPLDVDGLAELLGRVSSSPALPEMGLASRRIVEGFTPESFADNMERAIAIALSNLPRRTPPGPEAS